MDLSPAIVLATWAAGLAGALAVVARWRVVGPGFTWLGAGVTLLAGVPAAAAMRDVWAWIGCGLCAVGALGARREAMVVALAGAAAACFVMAAASDHAPVAAVSGAVLLGGVTGEMMLGHWYLVDPRLPRRTLRTLGAIGGIGAVADFAVLAGSGAIPWTGSDAVIGAGFVLLAVTTVVLMAAVWFALGERGYAGVMAATGLSYLAVLTAIGSAVLGRILAA